MKFEIVVKRGPQVVARVEGERDVSKSTITLAELDQLPQIEGLLERLTGLRFHIQEAC